MTGVKFYIVCGLVCNVSDLKAIIKHWALSVLQDIKEKPFRSISKHLGFIMVRVFWEPTSWGVHKLGS